MTVVLSASDAMSNFYPITASKDDDNEKVPADPSTKQNSSQCSLRYLNEFIADLNCASVLVESKLFPDAKEITESMGLYNAARRFFDRRLFQSQDSLDDDHRETQNGIIFVGDGSTPRTAALFALRLRGWTCYSVDPVLQTLNPQGQSWSIRNVVPIRAKIENVRIHVRRALVVLIHAHVSIHQALSGVMADEIIGIIALPCCNWYTRQETWKNEKSEHKFPDFVFDDFSILSPHREVRVWIGSGGVHPQAPSRTTMMMMDLSDKRQNTGWVMKSYVPPPLSSTSNEGSSSKQSWTRFSSFLEQFVNVPLLPRSTTVNVLLQEQPFALKKQSRMLILGQDRECQLMHDFFSAGCTHVYGIQWPQSSLEADPRGVHVVKAGQEEQHPPHSPQKICRLTDVADLALDVIVDAGALHTQLSGMATKVTSGFIHSILDTLQSELGIEHYICVAPRKTLRRSAGLQRNEQWTVHSMKIQIPHESQHESGRYCFVYSCHWKGTSVSKRHLAAQELASQEMRQQELHAEFIQHVSRSHSGIPDVNIMATNAGFPRCFQTFDGKLVEKRHLSKHLGFFVIRPEAKGEAKANKARPVTIQCILHSSSYLHVPGAEAFLNQESSNGALQQILKHVQINDRVFVAGYYENNVRVHASARFVISSCYYEKQEGRSMTKHQEILRIYGCPHSESEKFRGSSSIERPRCETVVSSISQ